VFDPRAPEVIELEMAAERYRTLFEQSRLKTEALERDLASDAEVREGQVVRLADDRYGNVSKGMRVGRVRRVLPNDQVPLARVVEVEPLAHLVDEATVVVAIDPPEGTP